MAWDHLLIVRVNLRGECVATYGYAGGSKPALRCSLHFKANWPETPPFKPTFFRTYYLMYPNGLTGQFLVAADRAEPCSAVNYGFRCGHYIG
jgi:hypothetical protein